MIIQLVLHSVKQCPGLYINNYIETALTWHVSESGRLGSRSLIAAAHSVVNPDPVASWPGGSSTCSNSTFEKVWDFSKCGIV
jgi:hypothetical protein